MKAPYVLARVVLRCLSRRPTTDFQRDQRPLHSDGDVFARHVEAPEVAEELFGREAGNGLRGDLLGGLDLQGINGYHKGKQLRVTYLRAWI